LPGLVCRCRKPDPFGFAAPAPDFTTVLLFGADCDDAAEDDLAAGVIRLTRC